MSEIVKTLSNEYLKEIMADATVARVSPSNVDLNTLTSAGCYAIMHTAVNIPSGESPYGILIIFVSDHYGAQLYISRGNKVYARSFILGSNPDFLPWMKLTS